MLGFRWREILADGVDGFALMGGLYLAGWGATGSHEVGGALGIVGFVIWRRTSELPRLQGEISKLQARVRECEEGKASNAWVAHVREEAERDYRRLDQHIERLEDRLP